MQIVSTDDDLHEMSGSVFWEKIFQIFICKNIYPEYEALKRLMKCHLSVLFSGRSKKMSSVFICQARSLFIEYFVALEIKRI